MEGFSLTLSGLEIKLGQWQKHLSFANWIDSSGLDIACFNEEYYKVLVCFFDWYVLEIIS